MELCVHMYIHMKSQTRETHLGDGGQGRLVGGVGGGVTTSGHVYRLICTYNYFNFTFSCTTGKAANRNNFENVKREQNCDLNIV
jgi:hypothetical protein